MFQKLILYLKNFDWVLFAAVMLLLCFGLVELYSITLSQDEVDFLNFQKQIIFVVAGVVAMFTFAFLDYYTLRSFNVYIYILGLLLLVGVLIIGKDVRGTRGWYDFGEFSLQPAEFVKIILVIFLARYFSSNSSKIKPLRHLILSGAGTILFAFLILRQPDFGTSFILVLLWFFMLIISGINKKYVILIGSFVFTLQNISL